MNLDHLVYIVPNLHQAIEALGKQLGVYPQLGGRHPERGTYNALLRLGQQSYLELLAIDPEAVVGPPRWMGVDLSSVGRLTRWAISSAHLARDQQRLAAIRPDLGEVAQGQRQMGNGQLLRWQLTQPLPHPLVEPLPFFIDWRDSPHPSSTLASGCHLELLDFFHPQPEQLLSQFKQLDLDLSVQWGEVAQIKAKIIGPAGHILLE